VEATQFALISACVVLGALAGGLAPAWVRRLPEPVPVPDGAPDSPAAEADVALTPIDAKPPYAELARWPALRYVAAIATAVCAGLLAWRIGWHPALPAWLYLTVAGVVLAYVDIRVHLLPNPIVLPSYPIVLVLLTIGALATGEWGALLRALICGAALWALFAAAVLIYPAGMGFGDVKLAGLLGLGAGWFGAANAVLGLVLAFCLGGLVSLGLVIARRAGRKSAVPFGPFLLVGFLLAALSGPDLIAWYVGRMPG
jgi:leader peptidase (prepilin peptidase) / N-methyltransferase